MGTCDQILQVQRYHDGELDAVAAAAVQAHLAQCSACAEELAQLQATSRLFASAARAGLSQIGLHRLHQRVSDEMDRGLVRLAELFSGIAAGVMLLGCGWLLHGGAHAAPPPQTPPPWVGVAVSMDTDKLAADAGTPAAQWYLADASHSNDEGP